MGSMSYGRSMWITMTIRSYLMELDTISSILRFTIESDMREVIPDRESDSRDDIGEEELVEHEEYPKWDDNILV